MRLMILGASKAQVNAILKAQSMGHTVIATDYFGNSIGKKIADEHGMASTFDIEGSTKIALEKGIDGIMTTGTDQPVLTVNVVAKKLGLPAFLSVDTAYAVTNKKKMKEMFAANNIPTVPYRLICKDFKDEELSGLNFPVVIKPIDSQGQRGIYKVNGIEVIRERFGDVIQYSRENVILVEEYYKNDEITVSGWVKQGIPTILTVTDRITFEEDNKLGICVAHEFPSKQYQVFRDEIHRVTEHIVDVFQIIEGPIYFQMLIGEVGLRVNEIACRIGGAYEDETIPFLTGIDILDWVIRRSLGEEIDTSALDKYSMDENHRYLLTELFFLKEGKIADYIEPEQILAMPGVLSVGYNVQKSDQVMGIENASQRAGYVILTGNDKDMLYKNQIRLYKFLKFLDDKQENLLIPRRINPD